VSKKKKTKKKSNPEHYVDNKKFYDALCVWKDKVVEAEECGDPKPPISEYIGECFLKMATGIARRPNFNNYEFKEEMIGDAIENCILYAHNFKKEGKNPFAYFTQMMYYAFIRRIQKEKKQLFVKYKLAETMEEFQNYIQWDDSDPHEKLSLNKKFGVSETDIENFTTGKKKTSKNKKKKKDNKGGTLDDIL
jgi:hypothetical protein